MPTYAYICPKCGNEFQKFHKMTVKTLPRCPKCRAVAQRRITGGAGLLFKGSGFYITDYKKTGEAGEAGEAGKTGKTPDKKAKAEGTGKSDPKGGKPDSGGKGSDH
jgi:putative FmdB family regulatory protein